MKNKIQKLYSTVPAFCKQNVSLNVLLSEKSNIDDGIKKELNIKFPENYYNFAYHSRILKKRILNKIICIKQLL